MTTEEQNKKLKSILGTLIAEIEFDGEAAKNTIEAAKKLLNEINN